MPADDQNIEKPGPSAYVGLIPAAGTGSRLADAGLSKEMQPLGSSGRPAIAHLLACLQLAGIRKTVVVTRPAKTALLAFLAGEEWTDMDLNTITTPGTAGVPQTAGIGLDAIAGQRVLFGFPDILFEPRDAFRTLRARLDAGDADVALGLFPTPNPSRSDMVGTDDRGFVREIQIKPATTRHTLTWIIAAWMPDFSRYLKDAVTDPARLLGHVSNRDDQQMGQVFQLALEDGVRIATVPFRHGQSLDIGTPGDLERAKSWPA